MSLRSTPQIGQGTVLRFGDCEMHLLTREFWRQGTRHLPPRRVFDLLRLLIEQRPRTVTKAEIAKAVWGRGEVRSALMAQVVMHARELVGDADDESRRIVTVRGIGYRFAGAVAAGAPVALAAAPQIPLDELDATFADAAAALEGDDLDRAQFQAERALGLAQELGINRQRARALSLAARVAITRGELKQAAGLAAQALRLAESEGLSGMAAEARLSVANVRMMAGDLHGALVHLQASYADLQAPGDAAHRSRCERLITLTYREMRSYEQALSWCARAQSSAREAGDTQGAGRSATHMVDLTLLLAEVLEERGQDAEARLAWERALALNAKLAHEVEPGSAAAGKLSWLGNQGIALRGLGRDGEAWEMLDSMQRALDEVHRTSGPPNPLWVSGIHRERALLLARSRRFVEAMAECEQALQAAETGGLHTEIPRLLTVASQVCEMAGKLKDALAWLRKSHAATDALQVQRASSQAAVLQAEARTDTLQRDLQSAVRHAQQLALENRALLQRLQQLEGARQRDEAGFMDAESLRTILRPLHADARERDVPFCIALLVVDNLAALQPPQGAPNAAPWLRELFRALTAVLGPAQQIVHWQPGVFVQELAGQGERRARESCQRLQTQLAAFPWGRGAAAAGAVPRVRVVCMDASAHERLDEALDGLLSRAQAEGSA